MQTGREHLLNLHCAPGRLLRSVQPSGSRAAGPHRHMLSTGCPAFRGAAARPQSSGKHRRFPVGVSAVVAPLRLRASRQNAGRLFLFLGATITPWLSGACSPRPRGEENKSNGKVAQLRAHRLTRPSPHPPAPHQRATSSPHPPGRAARKKKTKQGTGLGGGSRPPKKQTDTKNRQTKNTTEVFSPLSARPRLRRGKATPRAGQAPRKPQVDHGRLW